MYVAMYIINLMHYLCMAINDSLAIRIIIMPKCINIRWHSQMSAANKLETWHCTQVCYLCEGMYNLAYFNFKTIELIEFYQIYILVRPYTRPYIA